MTTAVSPLRPLSMGQLLDRAIRLYRQNFLTFVGIVAIAQIPAALFSILLSLFLAQPQSFFNPDTSPTALIGAGVTGFFGGILAYIFTQIATASLTIAIASHYLGEKIGILEAYRRLGRSWLSLLAALLVALLFGMGLMVWTMIPCIGWFTGFGMLFYFSLVLVPLLAPVIVLERQSASQAVLRAWDLARRRFWWLLGFVLLLTIFSQLIVTGPTLLVMALATGASSVGQLGGTTAVIIQQAISLVFSTLYLPMHLTAITLLYFDVRVRTEGFDLLMLAKGGESVPTVAAVTAPAAESRTKYPVPDTTELGYFAIMTVAFIALYFVLIGIVLAIGFAFTGLQ